jgi:hypothetical protein
VELEEAAKPITAFATKFGLFQWNVLPFGLTNAPATFERLMELVLRGINWSRCVVYLDDIIVFGRNFDETLDNLKEVLDRLRQVELTLKPKKCVLFKTSTLYLGFLVSGDGLECDPEKLTKAGKWEIPHTLKQLQSFLGFCNYHRRFIQDYAAIAEPLTDMTRRRNKRTFISAAEFCDRWG